MKSTCHFFLGTGQAGLKLIILSAFPVLWLQPVPPEAVDRC